jgi:hypothetical protein
MMVKNGVDWGRRIYSLIAEGNYRTDVPDKNHIDY